MRKTRNNNETNKTELQLLNLLKKVLPKATHDATLAGKIYEAIELELKRKARLSAFEKYCRRVELPDLEAKTLERVQRELKQAFTDGDLTLKPDRKDKLVTVELNLRDGSQFTAEIKVGATPAVELEEEQEVTPKFIPFPVCLPGDKELVWMLGKRENLSPDEAGIALTKAQEDFWGSKSGQKLLRDRVERIFPEFIARVPGKVLTEVGLKRHYKTPEALKVLRVGRS